MSRTRPPERSLLQHPLFRYTLLQVPGWLVLAVALYILLGWGWLGIEAALWVALLWVLKDVVLYPLYRPALTNPPNRNLAESLLGATGKARTEVADSGLVLIRGEFWRARSAGEEIAAGKDVQVCGVDRRVLLVRAATRE